MKYFVKSMKSKKEIEEDSKAKEEGYIRQLGYCPTSYIDDWEWEAQLKRLKQSDEQEKINGTKS